MILVPVLLALVAYVPLLLSAPGVVAADTKLYLYLDPWRLMSDAVYTWDIRQLGGWVPHQNVGYLWPSGPWYALFDLLRTPDWIAQRLWLGSILALAGIGTWYLCRVLETPTYVAVTAAFTYQMSPYVLPYISRTSALLLPWAMLPFMIALTVRMCRSFSWRQVLAFAVAVATAGGLNATALLMVLPGPALWLIVELIERRIDRRTFVRVAALLSTVTVGASAWWMAGLSTQGRYGAPVLSYSETLPSTSATSTATEALRGLGYWLFYDRPGIVPLTTASKPYQTNLFVIAAGVALVIVGVVGVLLTTRHRRALTGMLLGGVVLAVGAYPFGDSSPLWSLFADRPTSGVSLALRSSSRAVPLVALALAIGVGHTTMRIHQRVIDRLPASRVTRRVVPIATALVLVANLPALVGGRLIDPNVSRPERIPRSWFEAADFLDRGYDEGSRGAVLIVPGVESQAFTWGYTVDPILPGLTRKPLITRDWLPLGSAPLMDLLYALDDSFQNGTADPRSVAPIARLLGADTVMVVNSYQHERFSTIEPERAATIINDSTPGLAHLVDFGGTTTGGTTNRENDSESLPEISLYSVTSPFVSGVTTHPTVISGDGSSLIDLASTGLLDEPGIRLMSASLVGDELVDAVAAADRLIVTDGNRVRAHQWRGSQEVWGATEPMKGVVETADVFDSRLPVFPATESDPATRSYVADSTVTATATAYGALLSYRPEYRPSMAVDGETSTAWEIGWGVDPVGQHITITSDRPIDRLEPRQITGSDRSIVAVDVRVDDGPWTRFDASTDVIDLPSAGTTVTVRIADVTVGSPTSPVGFTELLPSDRSAPEFVRVPVDATSVAPPGLPVTYAFSRLRSDPLAADSTEAPRRDPETAIRRVFDVPHADDFVISGLSGNTGATDCLDSVRLDGIELSIRVDDSGAVSTCDSRPVHIEPGIHTLAIEPEALVDRIVLASESPSTNESSSFPVAVDSERVSRTIDVSACAATSSCWVQTSDGWNIGWSASVDGTPVGEPIAGASGRNTWRVTGGSTLRTAWDPQRRMWFGIAITIVTLVALLALTIVRRGPRPTRRRSRSDSPASTQEAPVPSLAIGRPLNTVLVTVVATIVISPTWGVIALVLVGVTPRRHLRTVGAALVTMAMLFVVAQQIRTGADAGFGWPSVFHRAHRPALLGLVILAVTSWFASPPPPEHPSPAPQPIT